MKTEHHANWLLAEKESDIRAQTNANIRFSLSLLRSGIREANTYVKHGNWLTTEKESKSRRGTFHFSLFSLLFTRFSLFPLSDCGDVFTVIRFFFTAVNCVGLTQDNVVRMGLRGTIRVRVCRVARSQ